MSDDDRHLVAFGAMQRLRSDRFDAEHDHKKNMASRIVAYGRRMDSLVDLQVETELRRSAAARMLYVASLSRVVTASSVSVAAAADRVTVRYIGEWRLEILEEADGTSWVVIHGPDRNSRVSMIEIRRPDGVGRRLGLGTPIDGVFQLQLDPKFEELADLRAWLRDPGSEIYLI